MYQLLVTFKVLWQLSDFLKHSIISYEYGEDKVLNNCAVSVFPLPC